MERSENIVITKEKLIELESAPKTKLQRLMDHLICFGPIVMGAFALLEYYFLPNHKNNQSTNSYGIFIGALMLAVFIGFVVSLFKKNVFSKLRHLAPFYIFVFFLLMLYDYLTLKTGILMMPYFPCVDQLLNAMIEERVYLFDCAKHSLILLFMGYFSGAAVGLITGIACGYSKKINYWVSPFMKLLGPIPSTTWLPIVMVLAASLFKGSIFIIALGVWYPVTMATITGINNIDKSYYEAAKTLGAKNSQLIFRIAIPSAIPNMFQGLTTGMSSACTALLVAEMLGVESGLGWYITWQKSWAQFAKMYAAIIIICLIFILVNVIFSLIKKRVLRWQEGVVQ